MYPDEWQLRVSQILVLPPFQRAGHGAQLLRFVYLLARQRDFLYVTVEDPSPVFQHLRDLTDLRLCRDHSQKFFQTAADLQAFNPDYALAVSRELRITVVCARASRIFWRTANAVAGRCF